MARLHGSELFDAAAAVIAVDFDDTSGGEWTLAQPMLDWLRRRSAVVQMEQLGDGSCFVQLAHRARPPRAARGETGGEAMNARERRQAKSEAYRYCSQLPAQGASTWNVPDKWAVAYHDKSKQHIGGAS